jgi:hypothetical protein
MSKKIKLLTSIAAQDALHLAKAAVRQSSTVVKVDRKQQVYAYSVCRPAHTH